MLSLAALGGGMLARMFTMEGLKFLAWRAFAIALCIGLGPVVIFKGFGLILMFMGTCGKEMMTSFLGSAGLEPQVVQLFGVGAYIGTCLKVSESVSVFLSFLMLKFIWGFLPGVRPMFRLL